MKANFHAVLVGGFILCIILSVFIAGILLTRNDTWMDGCTAKGGIPVRTQNSYVCVNKDVVLK